MALSIFSHQNQYQPDQAANDQRRIRRRIVLVITIVTLFVAAVVVFAIISNPTPAQKQARQTTTTVEQTVRKKIPGANVRDVKTAGGFAMATVANPTSDAQAADGSIYIFKVDQNGNMTQLAAASSFDPITLLQLGIPFATQAQLTGQTVTQILQNLCGPASATAPDYAGFQAIQADGQWALDTNTLISIEYRLTSYLSSQNQTIAANDQTICVIAQPTRDAQTAYPDGSTITSWNVQFITSTGNTTTHAMTITLASDYRQTTTLDGTPI